MSDLSHPRRVRPRPIGETRLELIERIAGAYGLVLFLILVTFVVPVTLPLEGWGGRVGAIAVVGLTAIIALTSSDVRLARMRIAVGGALAAVIAAVLPKAASSDVLLGVAVIIDALLLAVAAVMVMHRVVLAAAVDFRNPRRDQHPHGPGLLFGYLSSRSGTSGAGEVFGGCPTPRLATTCSSATRH